MTTQPNKHWSQKQRILHHLMNNPNKKIPCYYFAIIMKIMRYGDCLWKLKKEWYNIINEIEYKWDWKSKYIKHSNWIYIPTQ